ncbi:MAG: GIY-YIG nuclease family protein [Lachnospiraceae bacterium]|jgi:putative endonuclease|nr:GIY-YIG nuclease family protein [Lachnospiraceae bacterium]
MTNYTYILRCGDSSLYTGWTNNLKKRLAEHSLGKGAKYTRAHLPVLLVYYETFDTKEEAMRREAAIKRLSRPEKERLIASKSILNLSEFQNFTGEEA